MKKPRVLMYAAVFALSVATVAPLLTTPDAHAARIRINSNKSINEADVKVVNAFTNSFEDFISDVADVPTGKSLKDVSKSSLTTLEANNTTLQKHGFKDLNDSYKKSSEDIKSEAKAITEAASTTNGLVISASNRADTVRSLSAQMSTYNTKLTAMTSAVGQYQEKKQADKENGNKVAMWVFIAIAVAVVGLIAWFIVKAGRTRKEAEAELFVTDPAVASTLTTMQKRNLTELYTSLKYYEKAYRKKSGAAVMDIYANSGYNKYGSEVMNDLYGSFRAVSYEYAALIENARNNPEKAQEWLEKATEVRGNSNHYTETARAIAKK